MEDNFELAVKTLREAQKKNISKKDQRELEALYKQATIGDCNETKPYIKYRIKPWELWSAFKGMTKEEAMSKYIDKACKLGHFEFDRDIQTK